MTDQERAGSKVLMNFNRFCSQKQFHIDPACIRESSFLISFVMVQEISLSSQFQHKHIVQYYGTFKGYLVDVNGTVKLVDFGLAKVGFFLLELSLYCFKMLDF